MLQKVIVSVYELPEPDRYFIAPNGNIGIVFQPNKFYLLSARYDLSRAFNIVEKPIIHDISLGEYVMYFCESHFVEGDFYIFVSIGFGDVAVDLDNCVDMDLESEFEVNYDTAGQTIDSGAPDKV